MYLVHTMKRFLLPLFGILLFACKKDKQPGNNGGAPDTPQLGDVQIAGLVSSDKTFPTSEENIKFIFNPSKGDKGLANFSGEIYVYAGVITDKSADEKDWKYKKSSSFNTPDASSKMSLQSNGMYAININPRSFFDVPANEKILKLVMVFRNADGSLVGRNTNGSDIYLPLFDKSKINVRFSDPEMQPTFVQVPVKSVVAVGQERTITAVASKATNLSLTLNGKPFANASNATNITGKATFTQTGQQVIAATSNGAIAASFILNTVESAPLPSGVNPNGGITFTNGGKSATFVLFAPNKSYVNAVGDFNNWVANNASLMKHTPDGNAWWVTIDNLDANKQYAYQYWVDGNLKIADQYTEKILDPTKDQTTGKTYDELINSTVNGWDFGTYPMGKTTGIVSTFKPNAAKYNWQHTSFTKPVKNNLVIYELLLRDFLGSNNYRTLTDTLNYLSNLGVNAVELMPINEFEGNSSWGYNPDFYFAADKYYGSKQDLQKFIDACHGRGIAVILDVVLNHSMGQSPMAQLYWDKANNRPAADNPWYNTEAPHSAITFGNDFNHENTATKNFVNDVLMFWLKEYKADGFRFDFTKGFTQKATSTVAAMGAYDPQRIAILKTYNAEIKKENPEAYVILEHFCDDKEEQELAKEGMILWNNLNYNFNQASMGYFDNNGSDLSRTDYKTHGFTSAEGLVTYMESHDEERMMFKNLAYGNSEGHYNIKDKKTALKRQEMCAAFLFAVPGPKMIWQFGELGYEQSIEENGRTGEKPILWQYNTESARLSLKNAFSKFIKMKRNNPIFKTTNFIYDFAGAVKYIKLKDGNNTMILVGNFDVKSQTANLNTEGISTWYDAADNDKIINMPNSTYTIILAPGEYHIFSKSILNK